MVNHPGGGGMSFYPKNNWLLVTPQKANSTCQLFSLGRRPPCPSASALPVTLSFGLLSARSLPFTPPSCGSLCVAPDCRQSESPTESPPATAPKNKNGAGAQRNSAGSPPHDQHARKMVEWNWANLHTANLRYTPLIVLLPLPQWCQPSAVDNI